MRLSRIPVLIRVAACAVVVAGCSSVENTLDDGVIDSPRTLKERGGGTFVDDSSLLDGLSVRNTLLGEGVDENRLPVNRYLWRGALDTLSFLPLASIDTFSGVISTDWGATAGSSNERVRVTAYVRDAALSASALDVSVFRETLTPAGAWRTAAVDPATAQRLEDAILTRARQLRIADVDR